MKKEGIIYLSIIWIIFLTCSSSAIVGVSPGSYVIDAQPGLKQQFVFSYTFDEGVESEIYAEGYLSQYVTLSTNKLIGPGGVIVYLELPENIEVPGNHKLFIGARQIAGSQGSVGLVGNVRGVILVKVPYPGYYAVIKSFETTNANKGEEINITLKVENLGKETLSITPKIEILNIKNKSVEKLTLEEKSIESPNSVVFFKQLETSNYIPGDYVAVATIEYDGKEDHKSSVFRLGTLFIGISNYSRIFQRDKINQFYIEVESFWNDPIENVYADVEIVDHDIKFLTPFINLNPWSKDKLSGYFDTTGIEESKFKANITINYEGKKTSEIVNLKFKNETDYVLYALIGGGVFLGIIIIPGIILIIILLLRVRNNESESIKKSNSKKNGKRKINQQ